MEEAGCGWDGAGGGDIWVLSEGGFAEHKRFRHSIDFYIMLDISVQIMHKSAGGILNLHGDPPKT